MCSTFTVTQPPNVTYRLVLHSRNLSQANTSKNYKNILKNLLAILKEFKADTNTNQNTDLVSFRLHKWANKVFQLDFKDVNAFEFSCDQLIKKLMFKLLFNFASPSEYPQSIQEPYLNGDYLWEKQVLEQYLGFATISPFDGLILNNDPELGPVTLVWHEFAYRIAQWANQNFVIKSDDSSLAYNSNDSKPLSIFDITTRANRFVKLKQEHATQKTLRKVKEGMEKLKTEYKTQSEVREAEHTKQKEEFERQTKEEADKTYQEFKQKLDAQAAANDQNKQKLEEERAKNEKLQRQILEQEDRIRNNEARIRVLAAQIANMEANSGGGCTIL